MTGAVKNIPPLHLDMLIGGETLSGSRRLEVRNPAHPEEVVGTIIRGSAEDVGKAVAAAKAAQPAWAALTYGKRAQLLASMLDRLEKGVDERAVLFVRENGKVLADAKGELAGIATRQRLTLELAEELDSPREMPAPKGRTVVAHRPFGVVVGIVPWNSPVSLAFSQIVSALLAGNSIVIKPPETCPLALMKTIEMAAAVLPAGLVNVVTGLPGEIGDALTTHPDVAKIGFTGSVLSARTIKLHSATATTRIEFDSGKDETISRQPALSAPARRTKGPAVAPGARQSGGSHPCRTRYTGAAAETLDRRRSGTIERAGNNDGHSASVIL